jgi:hypothetical protein
MNRLIVAENPRFSNKKNLPSWDHLTLKRWWRMDLVVVAYRFIAAGMEKYGKYERI